MLKSVVLGAYGWAPADWAVNYYPDDLPEAWRGTYYANEFNAVLLPSSVWQMHSAAVQDVLDDLPEGFRCFFALNTVDAQAIRAWQTCWASFKPHVQASGVVSGLLVPAVLSDAAVAGLSQDIRCYRSSADALLSDTAGSDMQLAVVKSNDPLEPLAIKAVIEQIKNSAEGEEVCVFLDTPYQTQTQMQAMLELYGL